MLKEGCTCAAVNHATSRYIDLQWSICLPRFLLEIDTGLALVREEVMALATFSVLSSIRTAAEGTSVVSALGLFTLEEISIIMIIRLKIH